MGDGIFNIYLVLKNMLKLQLLKEMYNNDLISKEEYKSDLEMIEERIKRGL